MRYHMRPSSIELLKPRTPADRRALYELTREALRPTGASDDVIRLLAVAAVRHLSGYGGRILLSGDNSHAKITVIRTLAEALDLPFLEVDVGSLAETNWRGSDLPFFLERLHAQLEQRYARASVPRIAERACILLRDLQRVRSPGTYTGSSATRDYREGKALSLCPIAAEGVVPVARDSGGGFLWPSRRALVVATARFDGLSSLFPDTDALELWGIARPLAEALAAFTWIEISSPAAQALDAAIRAELQVIVDRFLSFGFHLRITAQVVRYVVHLVSSRPGSAGISGAVAVIALSADRILARLLDEGAAPGTVCVLARDDIDRSLGAPSTSTWRE